MSDVFRVGPCLVEPSLNTISCNGKTTRLEPKVMEVLVCLAQHPGETLPKEKLLQSVWPDTFVTEDVLKHSISELRRVFEDDAREPHVIQTISKRGYRLLARVEPINGAEYSSPSPVQSPVSSRAAGMGARTLWIGTVAVAAVTLLAVLLITFKGHRSGTSAAPPIRSLAVLPFQNLSADPAQEYFSDGLTDALITDLAQISSVKVISRSSIMRYKKTDKPLSEIAHELNVDGIVEGTVQRSSDHLRITAQLIHGPSDRHIWANSYERDTHDVLALERELTDEVARQIQAQLTRPARAPLAQRLPVSPKVLEAYLQGNYHLNLEGKGFGDEEVRKAQQYFQQAIDADPNFAPAYLGMESAHSGLRWPTRDDTAIRRRMAERAVALDPTYSDARVSLAQIKFEASWDWPGAEEEFRQAIVLNTNNAVAHDQFCQFLDAMARLDEAWKECQIAQELDPNNDHLSNSLNLRGQHDRAIAILLMMLKRDPSNGFLHWTLYRSYAEKGTYKEAVRELQTAATLYGFSKMAARLHRAFATSGYRGAMREWATELERLAATKQLFIPVILAETYVAIGEKDRAFYWLEEACKHHDILASGIGVRLDDINANPMLAPLRSDPRFKDMVRCIGLLQ